MIRGRLHVSVGLDGQTRSLWVRVAAALLAATIPFMSGCAGVLIAYDVVAMANALPSNKPHWVETNQLTFTYPVEDVYTSVVQSVVRNGRAIVESNAAR